MAEYSPIAIARFWSKVDVRPSIDDCWNWTAGTKTQGYGRIKIDGKPMTASRIAWELYHGEKLGERHALHQCDNPRCCNPHHITAGDHAQNMKEARDRNRFRCADMRGERNPRSKLTINDVATIKKRIANGENDTEISRDYPVSSSLIWRIRQGLSWRHVGKERTGGEQ